MKLKDFFIKIFLPLILSVVLVYFLLKQITLSDVKSTLSAVPFYIIIVSFIFYTLAYVLKTIRFRLLLKKNTGFLELFSVVSAYSMINSILPLRTGELSFIYMISKNKEKKTTALASLITTKIFDFVAVSCLFIVALIFLGINEKRFLLLGAGLIAIVICGIFLLFLVIKYYALFRNKMLMRIRVYKYTITKVGEILSDLKKIGDIKKSSLVFLISLGVWISNFLTAYFIVVAMNIKIGLYLTVLAFTFTAIISYLPIHGFFGFGTLEAEWTIIFMFFGVSKEIAISSGFGFHIINILYFLILGVIGLINIHRIESIGKNK